MDFDGERDAKSLVHASISDAMLLTKLLSATTTAATAVPPQLALAAPVRSAGDISAPSTSATAMTELQTISVLSSLNKRLNNLLVGLLDVFVCLSYYSCHLLRISNLFVSTWLGVVPSQVHHPNSPTFHRKWLG